MCFFVAAAVAVSGCVPVLVGVGVVTGYVAFKDTAAGNVDATFDDIWEAVLDVAESRTDIESKDKDRGVLKATVKDGLISLTVKVVPLSEHSYKLKVTARRRMAVADLETAQAIFTAIVRALPQQDPDGGNF